MSSVIGGSAVVLASVVGALAAHFLAVQRENQKTIEGKFDQMTSAIQSLDTHFTGEVKDLEIRQTDRFVGEIKDLEIRQTDRFVGEVKDLEVRLTDKFISHLTAHGERLARIESKLDIDPPAEAA
ncbi:MAG: hypothetical protein KTV68_15395 [Acidimicrobiia bacterium]|nr:hypothetical protein [Acidimicrobiia bacterium]